MTERPEAEATTPDKPNPNKLTGDDFIKQWHGAIKHRVGIGRDPHIVDAAVAAAHQWVTEGVAGAPVILLDDDYAEPKRLRISSGGVLQDAAYLHYHHAWDEWRVIMPVLHRTHNEDMDEHLIAYSDTEATNHIATHERRLIVGHGPVREFIARRGFHTLRGEKTESDITRDAEFLCQLRTAALPAHEYLGLSEDQLGELAEELIMRTLTAPTSIKRGDSLFALEYVLGIEPEDTEKREVLHSAINDQIAALLPIEEDSDDTQAFAIALGFAKDYKPSLDFSAAGDGGVDFDVVYAAYIADLYALRFADMQNQPDTSTPVVVPPLELTAPPPPQELGIFGSAGSAHVRKDIAYIRGLQAVGYPVTLAIERDEESMRGGINRLVGHAMTTADAISRAEAFMAMEYLFNLQRPEQREYFYELMTERAALQVPLDAQASLRGHIRIASTMVDLMPNPPTGKDGQPLSRQAKTVALLGRFYERRAQQLFTRQLRRFRPREEHEEDD